MPLRRDSEGGDDVRVTSSSDDSPVGCVGRLLVGTRGTDGPGEVLVSIRGSREAYLAYSDHPMGRGETVLVVAAAPHRTVTVVAWTDPFGAGTDLT